MQERIDPKGLKTLSAILALVLEDQAGESAAALEAVRRKARQDGVTGGALKNIFRQINHLDEDAFRPRPQTRAAPPGAPQLEAALRDMQRRFVEARLHLDRERRSNSLLRDKVRQLEHGPATGGARGATRLGALERHLQRTEELELQLQRKGLDVKTLERELVIERCRRVQAIESARLRWVRLRQGIMAASFIVALSADRADPLLSSFPTPPTTTEQSRPSHAPAQIPALPGLGEMVVL